MADAGRWRALTAERLAQKPSSDFYRVLLERSAILTADEGVQAA